MFLNTYRNSGKDYNDFGRFSSCAENENFEYMLMTCKEERCGHKFSIDISMGICVPKECSKTDVENILPLLIPILNKHNLLPKQLKDVADIHADDVELVLSAQENSIASSFHVSNFLVCFMFVVVIGTVITSSVLSWMRTKDKKMML